MSMTQFGGGFVQDDKPRGGIAKYIFIGVVVAAIALGSTLAANIRINTNGPVEFGQGMTQTVACTGNTSIKITPKADFTNSSGAGTFYFKSVTISNIPVGCQGYDFTINAFGNTSSTPLALFDSTSTNAIVYYSGSGFQVGGGLTGFTVSGSSDSFTATFTVPVAVTSTVYKITVQTGAHAVQASEQCASNGTRSSGGTCRVGDIGTGGGVIFYVSAAAFTSTGSSCGTNCHFLEYAPKGWASTTDWPKNYSYNGQIISNRTDANIDPFLVWSDGSFTNSNPASISTGSAIGTGMLNTLQIESNTVSTGKTDRFAYLAALGYVGNGGSSTARQWFIPSLSEQNELCKYIRGQVSDLGDTNIQCARSRSSDASASLGFNDWSSPYWSSTYGYGGAGQTYGYYYYFGNDPLLNGYYSAYGGPVRPIRAF